MKKQSTPLLRSPRSSARAARTVLAVLCLWSAPAAAQPEYAIGPLDILSIAVWEHEELSGSFSVEADGTISFPLLGRTKVGGLTVQGAEQTLEKRLAAGYVKSPQVRIAVEEYRSQQIFVMGEVKSPKDYPFTGELTLLKALALAGGPTERAGSDVLVVRPSGRPNGAGPTLPESAQDAEVLKVDLTELHQKGSLAALALRPGDTIFVPEALTVFISGRVAKPGEYAIRNGTTLRQALALAGGVTDRGSTSRIRVLRVVDGRETEGSIKLHEPVQPGDTIVVKERFF